MNINGVIWMVQMWLQWYFLKLRTHGVQFEHDVVLAQAMIQSALFEPTTELCLAAFRHNTQRTKSQWLASVQRRHPWFKDRLICETPPQVGKAKEEFFAKAFICLLPRDLPYSGSKLHQYVYGVKAYNPQFCGMQLGCQQVIPEYLCSSLNLENSFRPLKISLVQIAKTSRKMSRLLPGMEMVGYAPSCQCSDSFFVWWSGVSGNNFWQPTPNAFRDLFKGCDFAVGESAGDMETILAVIESNNQNSRIGKHLHLFHHFAYEISQNFC